MTLHPDFTKLVVDALPREVRELLVSQGSSIMVAGGFVRDTLVAKAPKDVDLFAVNKEASAVAAEEFADNDQYCQGDSANAVTFWHDAGGLDVQFITRDFQPDHMNTLLSFDFTINQAGVYHEGGQWFGIASEDFLEDFPNFTMRYRGGERSDVADSMNRVLRFVAAGWTISSEEYAKVVTRFIKSLNPSDLKLPEPELLPAVRFALMSPGYRANVIESGIFF